MASAQLRIAADLTLPLDAVTETFLIFGKKGSGKTATAGVFAEEMITAGLPVAVLDPMGAWWGLRSSADGKSPGLPVLIIGGEHADLPLTHDSGARIADLIVEERLPVVLDLFLMSKTQQRQFVTDFMERLFRRNRDPLHLIIDEADRWAPQRGTHDMARLLGAYEDIVLRGRRLGLGSTSVTLRVAQLNSAIRSQVEVLVAMRMLGKLDVQAIDEWIRLHATDEDAAALKASLPSLPVGTAWFWSPGWLEIMQKVQVRPRRTFDSSATPKVGERRIVPRSFAPVDPGDLERLAGRLNTQPAPEQAAKAVTSAETGRLRRQVSELTAALSEARKEAAREPERVEVPVLGPGDIAALEQAITGLRDIAGSLEIALARATAAPRQEAVRPPPSAAPAVPAPRPPAVAARGETAIPLSKAQRAILTVLAQYPEGRDKKPVAMLAGYSANAGHFGNELGGLRRTGLIEPGMPLKITPDGLAALGSWEPLPEGRDLVDYWLSHPRLGKAEREILRALLDAWPSPLTKPEVAERAGYSAGAGHFGNSLGRLRSMQLIEGSKEIRVDETLGEAHAGVRR
jgi:uncharacterized protein